MATIHFVGGQYLTVSTEMAHELERHLKERQDAWWATYVVQGASLRSGTKIINLRNVTWIEYPT